jgi:hypothetical protein
MNTTSIICDTNIWYSVDSLIRTDPQANLNATLINLLELCRSPKNLKRLDETRVACKQLVQRNKGICVYSPMKSIAIASGIGVDDGNEALVRDCMTFIANVAEGAEIDPARSDAFAAMLKFEQKRSTDIAEQLNGIVDSVREIGINKRDPNRNTDINSTKLFIASMIGKSIQSEVQIDQINWEEAELLLHTMHWLHLDLEVSKRRWQPNDVNDLYNLAYVGKGEKYWTLEKRWNNVIERAGMGHYLYRPA